MILTQGIRLIVVHLWQSTALAVVVALLSFLLQKNHARTRYWLWLAASMKFLLPFSLLVAVGSHLPKPVQVSAAFQGQAPLLAPRNVRQAAPMQALATNIPNTSKLSGDCFFVLLLSLWATGFMVSGCLWRRHWLRIRALARTASLQPFDLGVPVLSTPSLLEPVTFGILHPVVVLPQGLVDILKPEYRQAIIAHELCHIRYRDNLTGAMHMMVESIFWFFPPVWWIGNCLVEERERACDEEVLRLDNAPEVYAESILKTCRFFLESPLDCISGISGADLKKRILRIAVPIAPRNLGFAKKLLLTTVGMVAIASPVAFGVLTAPQNQVQAESEIAKSRPSFEVAVIRPNRTGDPLTTEDTPPGMFWAKNISIKALIAEAYELPENQIVGGPGWINSERYDIEAKMSDAQYRKIEKLGMREQKHQINLMLQSLLAERFMLTVHHQSRELKGYVLVVAKGGPKLHISGTPEPSISSPPGSSSGAFSGIVFQIKDSSLRSLVNFLSGQLGRPVTDETGLNGNYDATLEVPMDSQTERGSAIITALQDQFGLILKSRKVSGDIIVVAHIERPSEN